MDAAAAGTAATAAITTLDQWILQIAGTFVGVMAVYALIARLTYDASKSARVCARVWMCTHNAEKRRTEVTFIAVSALWISVMAAVVATGVYETFGPWEYMYVGLACALPAVVVPALTHMCTHTHTQSRAHWTQAYWVKANVWIVIITYVGNYFWTHYFYTLLQARYTFTAWRINNVPWAMFLCTHGYFALYHSMTNMALRRWYTSITYQALGARIPRVLGTAALVGVMAWVTAFMETFTIQGFPYYEIKDREYMYTVGSIVYGIYFIVSFPMFFRLDEDVRDVTVAEAPVARKAEATPRTSRARSPAPAPRSNTTNTAAKEADATPGAAWTLSQAAIDSLGACMLVTILLDLWRIWYFGMKGVDTNTTGLVWFS